MTRAQMTDIEKEEQLEAAIEVTEESNAMIRAETPDDPALKRRENAVIQLRGILNSIRGWDVIFSGA